MEVSDRVTLHDLITNPDFDNSHETMLHNAAFEMVQGMSAEHAIVTFANDGATCEGSTCIWAERVREPLGVLIYPGIRPPGPRRTFDRFRQVTIRTAVVMTRDDIVVRSWSKKVDETE